MARWMPTWSLEELEKCRAQLFKHVTVPTVEQRYTTFGGVPRFVLERQDFTLKLLLQGLDRDYAYRLMHLDLADARSDVRHNLAHAQVITTPSMYSDLTGCILVASQCSFCSRPHVCGDLSIGLATSLPWSA